MVECNSTETHNIYPNLNNQQLFRLNKINEINNYFVGEVKERELISKTLSKYIASFEYVDKFLIVLSVTSSINSTTSFVTVITPLIGIESASFSLSFSILTGIVKKLLKTRQNKNKKHNKIVMLARSKLNSIESKIYEALINNEISHEEFMILIKKERNYREIKESIRMINSQRSDTEKINLIEESKKIGTYEAIKRH